jgi:predicted O-linked N-acetylglucosamine transferase (SPINDLY family)
MGLFDRWRNTNLITATGQSDSLAREHFDNGNALLDEGHASDALDAYLVAVALKSDSAAIHFNIANALLRLGRTEEAISACHKALTLKPEFESVFVTLGVAHQVLGQFDKAVSYYRQSINLNPGIAEVHFNLGISLKALGQFEDSIACFDLSLALQPDYIEALHSRAIVLHDLGRFDEAVGGYRRAIHINPEIADIHNNLGSALNSLERPVEAITSYQSALQINPDLAETHYNLGFVFQSIGELDSAIKCYLRSLELNPGYALAHNNLGSVLAQQSHYESAISYFKKSIIIQPNHADTHRNLGITLATIGQLDLAIGSYRSALTINPDDAETLVSMAGALKDQGQFDAALQYLRRAIEIRPDYALAHSNLLFINNYVGALPAEQVLAEAKHFGEMTFRLAKPYSTWDIKPDPQKQLRIGFISGDLCDHPVGYFLESVLQKLTANASDELELFAYSNRHHEDSTSLRIKSYCRKWQTVYRMSDEALAQLIRADSIDILIDLSGHSALNRLPVFSWRPAPIQVSWLGYFATTGVSAINYLIADPWTLPQSQDANFTETIWRLPETRLCFTSPKFAVDVSPLPAQKNNYITFGCFNNLSKMNDAVVELWAQILNSVPGSRLFLKYKQLSETSIRQSICKRFADYGIDQSRLILEPYGPRAEYLTAYQRVDIALDPFPFPGGTTTAEALWMGVPVLTLSGERFLSRQGVGLLMNAGLSEWVATDQSDYVARAIAFANDIQSLATLRTGLRQQVVSSPIFDAPRFAQHFKEALREMWAKYCAA